MRRKLLALALAFALVLSLAACGGGAGSSSEGGSSSQPARPKPAVASTDMDVPEMGVTLTLPGEMEQHAGTLIFADCIGEDSWKNVQVDSSLVFFFQSKAVFTRVQELQAKGEELSQKEYLSLTDQTRKFAAVYRIDQASAAVFEANGGKMSEVTGYTHNELLDEFDGMRYYFSYNDLETENLGDSAPIYTAIWESLPDLKANIRLYTAEKKAGLTAGNSLRGLNAKTFTGESFTTESFGANEITLVNIWGTYCPPCIEEMPDLEKIYQEYGAKGVGVIGICSDTDGKKNFELGEKVIAQTGVTYPNLIPDTLLTTLLMKEVDSIPTTLFVDKKGNVVGRLLIGKRSYEQLTTEIDTLLSQLSE